MRYRNIEEKKAHFKKILKDLQGDLEEAKKQAEYQKENWGPGIMVLDADTAAMIKADDIECEIIDDKPIPL